MKTKADYEAYGADTYRKGCALPFSEPASWQQRAMKAGYDNAYSSASIAAAQTNARNNAAVAAAAYDARMALQSRGEYDELVMPAATAEHLACLRKDAAVELNPSRAFRLLRKVSAIQTRYARRTAHA